MYMRNTNTELEQMIDNICISRGKNNSDNDYPRFNSWIDENDNLYIEVAVVGFTKEEIKITFDGITLKITGLKKQENKENKKYIEKKLEVNSFIRTFELSSDTYYRRIVDLTLNCGILTIKFERINKTYTVN
jgi:HSP20 family molecular chaperone IbpA